MPIHHRYGFEIPPTPVVCLEEAIAEKLARYRRVSLARDLYDLQWFAGTGAFDSARVRLLWILKTYLDVVVDGRGGKPIRPQDVLRSRSPAEFRPEDIGYLTEPVRIEQWIETVRTRYAFLAEVNGEEARYLPCNARDLYAVEERLRTIHEP